MNKTSHKSICICGGGSLGHAVATTAANRGCRVNLLTGRPGQWSNRIMAFDSKGNRIESALNRISDRAEDVVPGSDLIILCVPGYLIEPTLKKIAPHLSAGQMVGSVVCSNGFFWIAKAVLKDKTPLFGFQRVPFICRVREYGKSVDIKGYKSQLKIAGTNNDKLDELAAFFTELFNTPTITLKHYLEATLSNSNPILHPARIYAMLSSQTDEVFEKEFLFYEEWDNKSSEVLIACDNEFQSILEKLPIDKNEIPPLLTYYESADAESLTRKIRSIAAFKGIKMAMIATGKGFIVDYANRYFTEDIPYGLLIIKSLGIATDTPTPMIDEVLHWMQQRIGKEYLKDNKLDGKDITDSGIIQNYMTFF